MPDPANYDSEDEWMAACVPAVMDEGKTHDAAVGQCMGMWGDKGLANPPKSVSMGTVQNIEVASVDRAWSTLTIKSLDAEQRTIEGIASTPTVDRVGDVVEPMGAKFTLPIPLLHHHDHRAPVGHVVAAKATKDGISIKATFAKVLEPGALKDRIDTAWQEVKAGLVRGLSIGFKPIEYEFLEDKSGGLRFNAWNWYELSLVTIPANADANITLIKSLDQNLQAASGMTETAVTTRPGASGKKTTSINLRNPEYRNMSKTVQEQLAALEAKRAANQARMEELMQKAVEEGRSTDDAERDQFDDLERENETLDGDIKRFKSLERQMQAKATPVANVKTVEEGAAARAGYVRVTAPPLPPGIRFARVARCLAMAQGNRAEAARIAEQNYSDDQGVVGTLKAAAYYGELSDLAIKAPVPAASTTDTQWAGALVSAAAGESGVIGDFLEFLRPQTILGKFGAGGVPSLRRVPFRTGLLRQTTGGAAGWVGEGAPKPVTKLDLARETLLPTKVATIAVITDELLRDASMSADTLIRDGIAAALRERLDIDFIDPTSTASGAKPASITSGVTALMSSGAGGAGTGTSAQVRSDIRAMVDAFNSANLPLTSAVWIMKSRTALNLSLMINALGEPDNLTSNVSMTGGTLVGIPIIVSEYVPAVGSPVGDFVVLLDTGSVWLADEGGINVSMSKEASIESDSAPAGAAATGSPGTVTGLGVTSLVSFWQENLTGFRCERTINWRVARTQGVVVLTGGNWGE